MQQVARKTLILIAITTAVLWLSPHIHGKHTVAGTETEITVGAFSPWLEYVNVPGRKRFQVNLMTWSMLCGVVALVCLEGLRRLSPREPTAAKTSSPVP